MAIQSAPQSRFVDGAYSIWSFKGRHLVACPNCRQRAEVKYDAESRTARFCCANCFYSPTVSPSYSLSVNQYCPNCDYRVEANIPFVKTKAAFIRLKCPSCNNTNRFTPRYELCCDSREYAGPADPYFGFQLWLQIGFSAEIFWAYNHEHLAHLRNYVGARLRERQSPDYSTMVERLPQFIKSAKNRKVLLNLIGRLELK